MNDTIRIPYPVEVVKEVKKPLSGWQNFQVRCGRIAFAVVYQKEFIPLPLNVLQVIVVY